MGNKVPIFSFDDLSRMTYFNLKIFTQNLPPIPILQFKEQFLKITFQYFCLLNLPLLILALLRHFKKPKPIRLPILPTLFQLQIALNPSNSDYAINKAIQNTGSF